MLAVLTEGISNEFRTFFQKRTDFRTAKIFLQTGMYGFFDDLIKATDGLPENKDKVFNNYLKMYSTNIKASGRDTCRHSN